MILRPATGADLPRMLEIYNEAVCHTTATYDYAPETLEERQNWFERQREERLPVLVVCTEEGRIMGWGALARFHEKEGYRFTVQNTLYVASDFRRQGAGRTLLEGLIQAGREGGYHVILAIIDAENQASIRLHEGFGFIEVARLKEVGYKFGRWLDVVYLQLQCG